MTATTAAVSQLLARSLTWRIVGVELERRATCRVESERIAGDEAANEATIVRNKNRSIQKPLVNVVLSPMIVGADA